MKIKKLRNKIIKELDQLDRSESVDGRSFFHMLDTFDEYPEISPADLEGAVHRRNFVEIHKQSINLMLDSDIITWFKKKSGENEYRRLLMLP
jgi:hypothetical protein